MSTTNSMRDRKVGVSFEKALFAVPLLLVMLFYLGILALTYQSYPPFELLDILGSSEVRHAIFLSLLTATVSSAIALVIGVPSAYFLARRDFPGKSFVDALLDTPVFLSPIAMGALLLVAFSSAQGRWFQEHVAEVVFAVPGIIVAQASIVTALTIRLMKATFESIPERYERVARSLGCTEWMAFRKVVLPLSKSGLIASAILVWARAIGEFGATVMLAGATEGKTATVPTSIYLSFSGADVNRALTLVLILILVATMSLVGLRRVAGRPLEL